MVRAPEEPRPAGTGGTASPPDCTNPKFVTSDPERRVELGQICYGVEIVYTGGSEARYTFTDFSITDD